MIYYHTPTAYPSKSAECKPQQLTAIGNRLLDWFSVIMADSKKRRQHSQKSKAHFPPACKTEAKWMFGHLDLNNDGQLSLQEMYDLEHDQNERCIKPFIDTCDLDTDSSINTREWCRCFEKTDRPCAAVRRRIAGDFAGEIGTGGHFSGYITLILLCSLYIRMSCAGSWALFMYIPKHPKKIEPQQQLENNQTKKDQRKKDNKRAKSNLVSVGFRYFHLHYRLNCHLFRRLCFRLFLSCYLPSLSDGALLPA